MNLQIYTSELLQRSHLSAGTLELTYSRPRNFTFQPGQRIRLCDSDQERDYSLANAPPDPSLRLCIRVVPEGSFSKKLHSAAIGSHVSFTGPRGHFVFRSTKRPAVFVATGTGAAPFASMARANVQGFTMLHGVRSPDELIYPDLFQTAASAYIPCISGKPSAAYLYPGRVTDYIEQQLPPGTYDFYLCGRREMVRDVTWLIDDRFSDSRIYTEIFF